MTSTIQTSKNPERLWAVFHMRYALDRLRVAIKAYDPDQPRAPGGTEEAGQWISSDSDGTPIIVAGGFTKDQMGMTVQEFISKMCNGGIHSKLPQQFLPLTIEELLAERKAGTAGAATCYKLLHRNDYRK